MENMKRRKPTVRMRMARDFVNEVGGQTKVVRLLGNTISQPAIARWLVNGIPVLREEYLRLKFPDMQVWTKYRLRAGARKRNVNRIGATEPAGK